MQLNMLNDLAKAMKALDGKKLFWMIFVISSMKVSGSSTNAWASVSGLSSTMAMSISPPSFLMRAVLPSCILFKIATVLFSHTFRSYSSTALWANSPVCAGAVRIVEVPSALRKGLSVIFGVGREVTAEATRRRSLSRISLDRDVFCVMSASALAHSWLKARPVFGSMYHLFQTALCAHWGALRLISARSLFSVQRLHSFRQVVQHVYCMLPLGINWLIKAYVGLLRLSGLKSELVKDRYVVLCTVTMSSPKHKTKQKQSTKNKQNTKTQKHKTQNTTHTNKPAKWQVPVHGWKRLIGARGDNLVSSQFGMAKQQKKQNTQTTRPYQRVSEATKYHAETGDPPRQDPRDHMA